MSRFSGKMDLYDWLNDRSDEYIKGSSFYIRFNGRRHPIDINSHYDAAKYYPYIVSIGAGLMDKSILELCPDSFIDTEERERVASAIKEVIEYKKRHCGHFDKDTALKELAFNKSNLFYSEIIDEEEKYGGRAECKNVHDFIHEYYRKEWFEHMVEIGYPRPEAFCWVYKEFGCTEESINRRLSKLETLRA